MRHQETALTTAQRRLLRKVKQYPGESSSFYANCIYGDRCSIMEPRVSQMLTVLEELDFITASNEPFEYTPCEHCSDTGRMSIGSGLDCSDCTYCDAHSGSCKGCSYKDCTGCNGRFYEGK